MHADGNSYVTYQTFILESQLENLPFFLNLLRSYLLICELESDHTLYIFLVPVSL